MAQTTIKIEVTTEQKQTITGFGAAAMEYLMRPIDETEIIRKAYEADSPIGLNILRMEMSPNMKGDITSADVGWDTPYDWHGYLPAVKEARSHGAIIMATPWSPPAAYKTNNDTSGGQEDNVHGKLKTSSYGSLFSWFNTFLTYMQNNGAPVDIVSIQNEPDWWVSYSGCEYTPQEQHDLVLNYAKRLNKEKFGVRLMSAEPLGFAPDYYKVLMEDPETEQYIDLLGGHVYGNYDRKENLAKTVGYAKGKEVWMTEHTVNQREEELGIRDLPTWHEQLEFVEDVHECLINGATAYVYWYLLRECGFIGDGTKYDKTECLTPGNTRGEILPRGRLMGQFARNLKGATRLVTTSSLANGTKTPGVNRNFENSAFLRGDSLIVNIVDTLSREFKLQLTLPYQATSLKRIQSTEEAVCAESDVTIEKGKTFEFLIPARSFTTYIFHIDDEALAVEPVKSERPESEVVYDLQGRRLQGQPQRKGIYIKNSRLIVK